MTTRRSEPNASDSTRPPRGRRSACPVAGTLDLVGDRWTLLVVRDLLFGKTRFGDFLHSAEGIPTNILTDRLKRLEEAGLIATSQYSEHPPRFEYHLTPEGHELAPVVRAVAKWGLSHLPDTLALAPIPD